MTEEDRDDKPKTLEEQLREMLKSANMSFMMGQPPVETARDADSPPPPEPNETEKRMKTIREFDLTPRAVRDYLDRFVVRQDEAKKVLAVAICDHYNHVRRCLESPDLIEREHAKHNIILVGPTGVGKTYLLRCIARLIGVPFVKADATKFSETGYVGHDVEDLVRDLVKAADGDTDLAQYGIIFLDEIDKIAAQSTTGGKDVSGRGVQTNLLKLMEDTDVGLFSQTDLIGQMQAIMELQKGRGAGKQSINTRHMLFIVSGAFDKLAAQVKQRVLTTQIGFAGRDASELPESDYLRMAQTRDFIEYGFEPEFVGRLPVRVVCDPLDAGDLEQIMLSSEDNILAQYRSDFEGYGISVRVERDAISAIAERAHGEQTGARGLMTVLEKIFRDFKFELPSTSIKSFRVDKNAVADAGAALAALLERGADGRRDELEREAGVFVESFFAEHGIKLMFGKGVLDVLLNQCVEEKKTFRAVAAQRFHDMEYGLKLIARNSGRTTFTMTKAFVDDPAGELSKRIAKSYGGDPKA